MSKFLPLWECLKRDDREMFQMTFEEIKKILGFEIDHSFLNAKKEAAQFGYQVGKISLKEKTVSFIKIGK